MIVYKFRAPEQIAFAFDIIFNRRLYCADWSTLNDPMEGQFAYNKSSTNQRDLSLILNRIRINKKRIKICSLSKTIDCHLLWAHYANGFSGMAIELEIPDDSPNIVDVKYGGVFAHVDLTTETMPESTAREILSSKYSEWKYEREVRILNDSQWYRFSAPVRRVIVGPRMNPSLSEALRIVCQHQGIEISKIGIGDEGIDADYMSPII